MAHYDVRFPPSISLGASYGPTRRTSVVELGSGQEERNQQWANSKRRYNAGYGITDSNALHAATSFWEGVRGRFHTFLWKDWSDFKSCPPQDEPDAEDQLIGIGDGSEDTFQLIKTYGSNLDPWVRPITKPVEGTLLIAVDGTVKTETTHYTVDYATGVVTFTAGNEPANAAEVTAGYEFDVPVRFDTDALDTVLQHADFGDIPSLPIVEVRL